MTRAARRLLRSEDGSATIEFVLLFPAFIALFLATFELGMTMMRQVMLDRALDLAVRDVRVGTLDPVTHDDLKRAICARAQMIPDCANQVRLEMLRVDPRNWRGVADEADCVDRADRSRPARTFVPGVSNQLVVVRACALFDPYFPTTGLGAELAEGRGFYALLSSSAFVVEPRSS